MRMIKISFKLFFDITIFCITTSLCFAEEISNPLYGATELYEEFYKNNFVEDAEVLQAIDEIQNRLPIIIQSQEEEQLFVLYLHYGLLLSSYYAFGKDNLLPVIEEFDAKVKAILKESSFSADVYLAYANYLYSKMGWASDSMSIVQTLPVLYRRALVSDDQRTEALTKLALWYAIPANASTPLWNAFIEEQEENIELFSTVDRFMGYLTMSMYYMRTYKIEKGWEYLKKAQVIFPDHILNIIIQDNYSKGVFGWQD